MNWLEILLTLWVVVGFVWYVYCQYKFNESIEEDLKLTDLALKANKQRTDYLQSMVFKMKEELERLKK